MKTLIIQHEASVPPGSVIKWFSQNQIEYNVHFFSEGLKEPDFNSFENVIICGGGMNVDQEIEFPWLKREKEFIRECIRLNKKIFGLCLGGQLLAEILGGKVFKATHWEIGWHDIYLKDKTIKGFHWHGYQFTAPLGAIVIAQSDACPHQAFTYGKNIFATQFHPEADIKWIEFYTNHSIIPEASTFVQEKNKILDGLKYQAELEKWFFDSLNDFLLK